MADVYRLRYNKFYLSRQDINKQEHREAGQYTPEMLYQRMAEQLRLLKPKWQEQEREHIPQKKKMMLSEHCLYFSIVIICVMTLFNILSDLLCYSYKIKTIIHVFPMKMLWTYVSSVFKMVSSKSYQGVQELQKRKGNKVIWPLSSKYDLHLVSEQSGTWLLHVVSMW